MNTKCESIAFGAVMLAILACLVWYLAKHPSQENKAPVNDTATSTTLSDQGDYYNISFTYPATTSLIQSAGSAADHEATHDIYEWLQQEVSLFKDTVQENTALIDKLHSQGEPTPATLSNASLSGEYTTYTSNNTLSYVFTVSEYTGGAHGSQHFKTFVFETKSGTLLSLEDLFTKDTPYLEALSKATREALYTQLSENASADFINPGTTPDAENFQFFALDGSDLLIFFPPYAVGPYALGPQTVRIPRSSLNTLLKPEFQTQ